MSGTRRVLTWVLLEFLIGLCSASTHWVVTEKGRIQPQADSPYRMNRPYDLVEFLKQEERAQVILKLYEEMMSRKTAIDSQWSTLSQASEIEKKLYWSDDDCMAAKKAFFELDSYSNVVDYACDRVDLEQIVPKGQTYKDKVDLDCTKFSRLDFSMATFPHLQVLGQPWNLTWAKETEIEVPLSAGQIYYGLSKNRTSWFLYNLASLYWRSMGDSQKALDCIKRAVHFATREHKDAPLFNLGVMLQRAHCTAEAAILLHSSVDHAPLKPEGHFVLANVYTLLGDYNRSIACYDNVLRLTPKWGLAKKARHAVVCHNKIKQTLNQLQTSLQDIINQLQEYNAIYKEFIKNQEDMLTHQDSPLGTTFSQLLLTGCSVQSQGEEKATCERIDVNSSPHFIKIDALSLQILLAKVESQAQKLSEQLPLPPFGKNEFGISTVFKSEDEISGLEILLEENSARSRPKDPEKLTNKELTNFSKYQVK